MRIKPPTGFATRPEASKLFNRSQRQLERDLDVAYLAEDDEVLCRYKLMTKEGELRDAKDVTTKQVKQLQSEGMIPVWYVETSYLEREYGRKGEPKPAKMREHAEAKVTLQQVPNVVNNDPARRRAAGGASEATPLLLSDAEFLRERILTLEQQNQQEKDRHDRIVEKLFAQLDVKDKQISAWDEVTQGLTKGLATGQLAPRLLSTADDRPNDSRAGADDSKHDHVQEADVVESSDSKSRQSESVSSEDKKSRLPSAAGLSAAVGEGSAPAATTKLPKRKSRKNAKKKSSRKNGVSKKRSWTSAANSETKIPTAKGTAKSPPKPAPKSRRFFSRFFRL